MSIVYKGRAKFLFLVSVGDDNGNRSQIELYLHDLLPTLVLESDIVKDEGEV